MKASPVDIATQLTRLSDRLTENEALLEEHASEDKMESLAADAQSLDDAVEEVISDAEAAKEDAEEEEEGEESDDDSADE